MSSISSTIPIVFVPALFGSELVRKNGDDNKIVYVTASIGLNIRSPDISLPLKWHYKDDDSKSLPKQHVDDIVPGMVLEQVKLSCVTLLDQYSKFCQHYEKKSASSFYSFAYDWRRDLNESTDNLVIFLEKIKQKHNAAAQVISHSLGCLIALAALKTNPSLFHSALFVGGNFGGGAGFYPTNTTGMKVGLNRRYLSSRVCHTFPSMYAAASPMGVGHDPILKDDDGDQLFQFFDSESLESGKKKIIDIDMYNLDHWKLFKLGPWSLKKQVTLEMEEHVRTCLKLGKHFQERMRTKDLDNKIDLNQYPKVAVLVGDKHPKPSYFLWKRRANSWLEWNKKVLKKYKPEKFVKTDGTVSYISARQPPLPDGIIVKEYLARNNGIGLGSHRELMDDVEMIDKILVDLATSCIK